MKLVAALMLFAAVAVAQGNKQQGAATGAAPHDVEPGFGLLQACTNAPAGAVCKLSANSALIPTHDTVHENENYCSSSNGTTGYTCSLPHKAITAYQTGMTFVLVADATCQPSCTLNIDSLGARSIKLSDGSHDPSGALIAGQPQWVFFDGNVFRLMGGGAAGPAPAPVAVTTGNTRSDSIARRFIAAMETMTYAPTVMLETTAGDLHKTTTNDAVGNATIDAATSGLPGQHMWIIITNDQLSAKTVSFGKNFKSAGPLRGSPGKSATLQFISDGLTWYEVARTTNL